MSKISLAQVVEKLDRLDGTVDLQYYEYPLVEKNATGACFATERLPQFLLDSPAVQVNTTVTNEFGVRVHVDCAVLTERLNSLWAIGQRLPSFGFVSVLRAGGPFDNVVLPTVEELFGFHIVDHMIVSLLTGINTTEQSFSNIFGSIPFDLYSQVVGEIAAAVPGITGEEPDIHTASEAYELFRTLGEKYEFNTDMFNPGPASK